MSVLKSVGRFLQATVFGGTYDDLAFEIRVVKKELGLLHDRLDKELEKLSDRLDKLEGKPGKGRGRGRLQVLGAAAAADAKHEQQAAPVPTEEPAPTPVRGAPRLEVGTAVAEEDDPDREARRFHAVMSIAEAHRAHPGAPAVFAAHDLPSCLDCPVSEIESVEEGASNYGLNAAALLGALNRLSEA